MKESYHALDNFCNSVNSLVVWTCIRIRIWWFYTPSFNCSVGSYGHPNNTRTKTYLGLNENIFKNKRSIPWMHYN